MTADKTEVKENVKAGKTPNKEQELCITTPEDKYLVIAGPGTGKTYTVTEKIKYLVNEIKIEPERILCLTFSNTAANEMKERVGEDFPINVFTFHSFCLNIIENFKDDFEFDDPTIISGTYKRTLINECIKELHRTSPLVGYNDNKNNPYAYAKTILDGIEEIKKNRIFNYEQFKNNLETNPLWKPRLNDIPNIQKNLKIELEETRTQYSNSIDKKEQKTLKKEIDNYTKTIDKLSKEETKLDKKITQMGELWELYKLYETKMKNLNYIDHQDMINVVLEKFDDENSEILKEVASLYDYVLVDEYQDTNSAQNEIVFKLAQYCPNIFVVGDDDQIIYTFQGAHLDTVEKFINKFGLKKQNINCLVQNHRSTEAILKFAAAVADLQDKYPQFKVEKRKDESYQNKEIPLRLASKPEFKELGIDKTLIPANKKLEKFNDSIEYLKFNSAKDEMHAIVNMIADMVNPETGTYCPEKLSDIAILTRNNNDLYEYETYLKSKNIEVEFTKGKNIFTISSVKMLMSYMQFLSDPVGYSEKMYSCLLMYPFHINPIDYKILKDRKNKYNSIITNMRSLLKSSTEKDNIVSKIQELLNSEKNTAIEDIKLLLDSREAKQLEIEPAFVDKEKIENFIKVYTYLQEYVKSENYKNSILEIGMRTGIFDEYLHRELNRAENLQGIYKLLDEADGYFAVHQSKERSFNQFVEYITQMADTNEDILTVNEGEPKNAVQLSTYHSSKGREFECVFMPSLYRNKWEDNRDNQSIIPEIIPLEHKKGSSYQQLMEQYDIGEFLDDIKLLFVGVTRAKHKLILSSEESSNIQLSWYIKTLKEELKNQKLSNGKELIKFKEEKEPTPEYVQPMYEYNYKEFENIALPQKFSPSALNIYKKCPRRYFFNYILDIKNEPTYSDNQDTLPFGNVIHETFQEIIEYAAENKKYPETVEDAKKIFLKHLDNYSTENTEEVKERGYKLLENYYEKFKTLADPKTTKFETEKGFTCKLNDENIGEINFYGKLDRIDIDNDGNCIIYDYKTGENTNIGKNKSSTHWDYYYQMGFYKYLLKQKGYNVTKVCFIYPEIEIPEEQPEDDKKKITNEVYITELEDDLNCEAIKDEYIEIVKNIKEFNFDIPDKPACGYCNYGEYCHSTLFCPKKENVSQKS